MKEVVPPASHRSITIPVLVTSFARALTVTSGIVYLAVDLDEVDVVDLYATFWIRVTDDVAYPVWHRVTKYISALEEAITKCGELLYETDHIGVYKYDKYLIAYGDCEECMRMVLLRLDDVKSRGVEVDERFCQVLALVACEITGVFEPILGKKVYSGYDIAEFLREEWARVLEGKEPSRRDVVKTLTLPILD